MKTPSDISEYLQAPWVWALILILVLSIVLFLAIAYPITRYRDQTFASERQARIREIEHEEAMQGHLFAFENEQLRQRLELVRREQERRDRESAQRADAADRSWRRQERLLEIELQDREWQRKRRNQRANADLISERVADLNRATEAVRDLNAARLGITPRQYEQLRQEQSGW